MNARKPPTPAGSLVLAKHGPYSWRLDATFGYLNALNATTDVDSWLWLSGLGCPVDVNGGHWSNERQSREVLALIPSFMFTSAEVRRLFHPRSKLFFSPSETVSLSFGLQLTNSTSKPVVILGWVVSSSKKWNLRFFSDLWCVVWWQFYILYIAYFKISESSYAFPQFPQFPHYFEFVEGFWCREVATSWNGISWNLYLFERCNTLCLLKSHMLEGNITN